MRCPKVSREMRAFAAAVLIVALVIIVSMIPSGYLVSSAGACTDSAPTITLSSPVGNMQSNNPGKPLVYTVSVKNNDRPACGSSPFFLTVFSCPAGWICYLGNNQNSLTVTVPPNSADTSQRLTVISPSNAPTGTGNYVKVKGNYNYTENFDDFIAQDWSVEEAGESMDWGIASNYGDLYDSNAAEKYNYEIYTKKKFGGFSMSADVAITGGDGYVYVGGRYVDKNNWYAAAISASSDKAGIHIMQNGVLYKFENSVNIDTNTWYTLELRLAYSSDRDDIRMYLDGVYQKGYDVTPFSAIKPMPSGYVFLGNWKAAAYYDNARIVSKYPDIVEGSAIYYVEPFPKLTINKKGTGRGDVSSTPQPQISCGSVCSASYEKGTRVIMTASPHAGSTLSGWGGAPSCFDSRTCNISMAFDRIIQPKFVAFNMTHSPSNPIRGQQVTIIAVASHEKNIDQIAVRVNDQEKTRCYLNSHSPVGACSYTTTFNSPGTYAYSAHMTVLDGQTRTLIRTPVAGTSYSLTVADASVDVTRPIVTADHIPASPAAGQAVTIVANASDDYGLNRIQISINGKMMGECLMNGAPSGICTYTIYQPTAGATYSYYAEAYDLTYVNKGSTAARSFTVGQAQAVTQISAPAQTQAYALTVSKSGNGFGKMNSNPAGISNCGMTGGTCSKTFPEAGWVELTASASSGSAFTGWGGECTGTAQTCIINVDRTRYVTATFVLSDQSTLVVTKTGTGSGSVSSNPAGISSCGMIGGICSKLYPQITWVALTALASQDSVFTGWSGGGYEDSCSGTGTCTVNVRGVKNIVANFNPKPQQQYSLTVSKSGSGSGTVVSVPAGSGINCGNVCSASYTGGTGVTLAAFSDSNSNFDGWWMSGTPVCGLQSSCVILMNATKTVWATFSPKQATYRLYVIAGGYGKVVSSPEGIDCGKGGSCSKNFTSGTNILLTAIPDEGYSVSTWSMGGCSGSGTSCTVTMDNTKTVAVGFKQT